MLEIKTKFYWITVVLILSYLACANAYSQETNGFCAEPDNAEELKKVFPESYGKASLVRQTVCQDLEQNSNSRIIMLEVVELLKTLDDILGDGVSDEFVRSEKATVEILAQLTTLEFLTPTSRRYLLVITASPGSVKEQVTITIEDDKRSRCDAFFDSFEEVNSCRQGMRLFASVYNYAQSSFSLERIRQSLAEVRALAKDWEEFYRNSRSQILLELAYNGKQFQKANNDYGFRGPPDSQTILLHPSIVIENVSDAIDGQEAKEAILLELWGKNYWRSKSFTGFSLGLVLADRPGNDLAAAVSFHYKNAMTIGFSYRDNDEGESGVFVSYDFLKGVQDKKQTLENYRKEIESQP